MNPTTPRSNGAVSTAIEITIRIAILLFLFGWCYRIIMPFVSLMIWAMVIAIAVHPLFEMLKTRFGGRGKLAATVITVVFLLIIILPAWLMADSMYDGIQRLRMIYDEGEFVIPPPGDNVSRWPAITKPIVDFWLLASQNLTHAMAKFGPQLKVAGRWLLSVIGGTSLGVLQFIGSIIISGILLVFSEEGGSLAIKIFVRLAGSKGVQFAEISRITIRNVVRGILGVSIAQTLLAGVGFAVAGVPLAGLWTLFCLIFSILQVGVGPVVIPAVIYMFATSDALTASLFLVWSILVALSDNILKPVLMGKGAPVPMLVVFLGSLGGFMSGGFIGLFIGPVILTLGYKLFLAWVDDEKPDVSESVQP